MSTFNLLDEPWIEVTMLDGAAECVSIRQAFQRAGTIRTIGGEVPTQSAAIFRLLLAILHRAGSAEGFPEKRWSRLWERGTLDQPELSSYLDKYEQRFDLLHPTRPFYQVADLQTAKGEFNSLARLVVDVPAGHQFFTTRTTRSLASMSLNETARWVVHAQAFDPSGIKSGALGDSRVKGGRGYPIGMSWVGWLGLVQLEGASLFESLLLNLDLREATAGDSAVWEREPQGPGVEEEGRVSPRGVADLLTWQSRRIRLQVEGDVAVGVLLCNGDALHPRNRLVEDRMTAWRRSKPQEKATGLPQVYMPRTHSIDRAVWRGLGGLLGLAPHGAEYDGRSPGILEWVDFLQDHEVLPLDYPLRLRAIGVEYGSNNSVVDDIYDDALSVRTVVLSHRETKTLAVDAVGDAEHAVRAISSLAGNLALAAGGSADAPRGQARARAYAALDAPYRRWVQQLNSTTEREAARGAWQRQVRLELGYIADELIANAGAPAWSGRMIHDRNKEMLMNSPIADRYFRASLRRALPQAFPSDRPAAKA